MHGYWSQIHQKKVDLSVGFFMSFVDVFETLFIVKLEKKTCRNVFCNERFDKILCWQFQPSYLEKEEEWKTGERQWKTLLKEGVFIIVISNEEEEETN
jgi:hypothetical protein